MTRPVLVNASVEIADHPLRDELQAAITAMLRPSTRAVLIVVANDDANEPIAMRAVPNIEPLVEGMLVAACEFRAPGDAE